MKQKGRKDWKIGQVPVRVRPGERRRDGDLDSGIGKGVAVESLDVLGDLTVRRDNYVVAGTRVAEKISQHSSHEHGGHREGRESADEDCLASAADDFVGTTTS